MGAFTTLRASCLCGQVQTDIPFEVGTTALFCSCRSCRRCTGAPFLTIVSAAPSFTPSQDVLDKLVPYDFSDRLTQYHCSSCGTILFTRVSWSVVDADKGVHWDVMCGILERFDGVFELAAHEFVADTLDGGYADFLATVDGRLIERWSHRPGKSELLPAFWQSPDRPRVDPDASSRLRGHCKCGGVKFWISRPSKQSERAIENSKHGTWWLKDSGRKFLGVICTCNSCRLDTGMEFSAYAFVPLVDISLDADGKVPLSYNQSFEHIGTLKEYRSSPRARRYHCDTCGASVFYVSDDRTGLWNVAAGLLDTPEGARAESWVEYWTAKLSWREDAVSRAESLVVGMENGLKEFARTRGFVHTSPV